ncbi:MAG: hypothetical protein COA63_001590 [Methylophaga sp.]|nr:hypothetical protein [Methylophaga sp.]
MKNLLIIVLVLGAINWIFTYKSSTATIVNNMTVDENITFKGVEFKSDWDDDVTEITNYLRQKDRHYDKGMPIVTYNLILTSGEYNDPEIVSIENKGGGNYYWRANKQPQGSIMFYHLIPSSAEIQTKLDELEVGKLVTLRGKISENNKIVSSDNYYVSLNHGNHKYILIADVVQ